MILLATAIAVLVTVVDIFTPLGYGEWAFYIVPVLVLSGEQRAWQGFWIAGVTSVLMTAGLLLSPPGLPFLIGILNRFAALVVIWITAFVLASRNRAVASRRVALEQRNSAYQEIQSQKEFYELVLTTTPVGIGVTRGTDFRFEYVNPAYSRIPGKSPHDILGATIPEIFPDFVAQGGMQILKRAMESGKPVHLPELQTYVGFGADRRNSFFDVTFVSLEATAKRQSGLLIVSNDITQSVLNRSRLQRTAARDEAILSSINDGLVVMSPEGVIEYMNQAGLAIDGYSSLDEVRMALPMFAHTWCICDMDGNELQQEQWPLARAQRESFSHQIYRVKRRDMDLDKYCSYSGRPVYDTDGNLIAVVATFQDITGIKSTEKRLRQRELEYKTLAENTPEVIARFDRQLRHTYVNEYGARVYGVSRDEVIGKTNADLGMPPEKVAFWKLHFEEVFKTGRQQTVNFDFLSPNYGHQYFSSLIVPEYSDGHVRSVIAITRDVTELRKAENALRESEKKFRRLADSMPQLVWTANPDGTVDYYNQKYREFGGIAPGEDGKWTWGPVLHEDDLQLTLEAWNRSLKTGEVYQIEHRVKHADGSFHWYLSRGVPARDENGRIVKWYGTATNIDISKNAQAALAESERHLKILNESLEDLVVQRTEQVRTLSKALTIAEQRERKRFSYVLHENLQQLLLGAKMLLGQHLRDHKAAAQVEEYDDVADGLAILERALHTTKTMSIELNPPVLRNQGLDAALGWLVDHMLRNYQLKVALHLEGPVGSVKNETQLMLTQMVRELLNNVVQHAGISEARVDALYGENQLQITVSDKGRGFDAEGVLRETADETRLGLFSIRERLRLFGGDLSLRSSPGEGTISIISLPV